MCDFLLLVKLHLIIEKLYDCYINSYVLLAGDVDVITECLNDVDAQLVAGFHTEASHDSANADRALKQSQVTWKSFVQAPVSW